MPNLTFLAPTLLETWRGHKISKVGPDPVWPNFAFLSFVPLVMDLRAKFDVSNRSRDMEGSQNFKSRSRDLFPTPFDLILHLFRSYPWWWIWMPNLTFLAPTVPQIWRRSQSFKSWSRDPSRPPLTYFCISYVSTPGDESACLIWLNSNRSQDMEGVPKFQIWVTLPLPVL